MGGLLMSGEVLVEFGVFLVSVIFFAGGFFAMTRSKFKSLNGIADDIKCIQKELVEIRERLVRLETRINNGIFNAK